MTDDPYFNNPDYDAFIAEIAKHCHCADSHRPCDGVAAGGFCDNWQDDEHEWEGWEECDNA